MPHKLSSKFINLLDAAKLIDIDADSRLDNINELLDYVFGVARQREMN